MIVPRTRAERRADALAAEARKLRLFTNPNREQRARLAEIVNDKLPAAWRAVNAVRARER